ncbi:MAG: hypothetical protein R2822_12225 [Spirosomataceae bacterium]
MGIVGALVVVWLPLGWKIVWTLTLVLGASIWVMMYSYQVYRKEKSTLLLFIFSFCFAATGHTQIAYEGTLNTLKFGLQTDIKAQTAQIYIPEQGLFDYKIQSPIFRNDSLIATMKAFGTVLNGKLTETSFSGQWRQNGFPAPVSLKKVEKLSFLNRPQRPQEPFPYQSENVTFTNANQSITFGGTFTFPQDKGLFTTVILISGSGSKTATKRFLVINLFGS